MYPTIFSQAEISKCDMVATSEVAHQVEKSFINRVQVMPSLLGLQGSKKVKYMGGIINIKANDFHPASKG